MNINMKAVRKMLPSFIPLILLGLFLLCFVFPQYVPMLQVPIERHEGIETKSFSVSSPEKGKNVTHTFLMKKVPAGVSPGGCSDIPDAVKVEHPFWLAETEVTAGLWTAVYKISQQKGYLIGDRDPNGAFPDPRHPAVGVSWRDAIVWCNALSEICGLEAVYYDDPDCKNALRSVMTLQYSNDRVIIKTAAGGFRLPLADEWELAARYIDGTKWSLGGHPSGSPLPYYATTEAQNFAIFNDIGTERVKMRGSNKLGIYDMSGNAWEWCFDSFIENDEDLNSGLVKRVVRGGSWMSNPYRLQIGGKFGTLPDSIERGQGFRVAMNSVLSQ